MTTSNVIFLSDQLLQIIKSMRTNEESFDKNMQSAYSWLGAGNRKLAKTFLQAAKVSSNCRAMSNNGLFNVLGGLIKLGAFPEKAMLRLQGIYSEKIKRMPEPRTVTEKGMLEVYKKTEQILRFLIKKNNEISKKRSLLAAKRSADNGKKQGRVR